MKTRNIGKILNQKENMKTTRHEENLELIREYRKNKYEENYQPETNKIEKKNKQTKNKNKNKALVLSGEII